MHVVDTNVVVRYVTNDDRGQSPVARRFVDSHDVRVLWAVLMECEWVLRSAHKLSRARITFIMQQFAGLPTVHVDDPETFATALDWFAGGMDFADAMHLAACAEGDTFATFDRKLARAAAKAASIGAVQVL